MRIHVITNTGRTIRLLFPTRLLLNEISVVIAAGILKEKQMPIPRAVIASCMHSILDYRKQHPDWVLLDVESSGGKKLHVKL